MAGVSWADRDDAPHGDQTCSNCGGYKRPMGQLGRTMHEQCRDCGSWSSKPMGNKLEDVLAAGAADY